MKYIYIYIYLLFLCNTMASICKWYCKINVVVVVMVILTWFEGSLPSAQVGRHTCP